MLTTSSEEGRDDLPAVNIFCYIHCADRNVRVLALFRFSESGCNNCLASMCRDTLKYTE